MLKVTKQSLNDWSITGDNGYGLAWITRGKDKIFTVTYTRHLTERIETPDFALSFKEAKQLAFKTINHFITE
jgi:hypothetical protein